MPTTKPCACGAERCTCDCPDGPGHHLVGCHVYDTDVQQELREEWSDVWGAHINQLQKLMDGRYTPRQHSRVVQALAQRTRALCSLACKMLLEDRANSGGRHDLEPWK